MSGFKVKTIRATADGLTDMAHLRELCSEGGVAGLMLTNPNTCGIFETDIKEICETIHAAGGLVYMECRCDPSESPQSYPNATRRRWSWMRTVFVFGRSCPILTYA